jgi:hypothetical protein
MPWVATSRYAPDKPSALRAIADVPRLLDRLAL